MCLKRLGLGTSSSVGSQMKPQHISGALRLSAYTIMALALASVAFAIGALAGGWLFEAAELPGGRIMGLMIGALAGVFIEIGLIAVLPIASADRTRV